MQIEFHFGTLRSAGPAGRPRDEERFRIAVLGDFSAHAHRGLRATGRELALRKPWAIDVDNFEDVRNIGGLTLL